MTNGLRKIQTERMHLFDPNTYIAMCVEIAGNPCDEQIKSAIGLAVSCHESLQSKIVLKEDGNAFYVNASPSYQVQCYDTTWTNLVEDLPKHPLDIFQAEMIRFYIIRNAYSLQLLIAVHHLAGDGLSIVYFIEDFMKALNGIEIKYSPLKLLEPYTLPRETCMPLVKKWVLQQLNKQWKHNPIHFSTDDYYHLLKQYGNTYQGHVLKSQLDTEITLHLLQYAKEIGLSVNTLLVTALLKEYEKEAIVGLPISVREPDNRSMSNWVSGLAVTYHYDSMLDFVSNARNIQKQIYKYLHNKRKQYFVLHFMHFMEPSLIDAACMTKYSQFLNPISSTLAKHMNYTGTLRDMGVTNLARVAISNEGPYTVKNIVFVPPLVPYCQRTVGVITFENTMNITMHSAVSDQNMESDFLDRAVGILCAL